MSSYGAWSAWSSCSESCQSNPVATQFQMQTRPCLGATLGGGCAGPWSQTMAFSSEVPCPDFISARGACSASCQLRFTSPTQTRNRQCVGATFNDNCNGAVLTDTQNCNVQVYCPGTYGAWSAWSSCSESCQSNHIRRWLRCFSNYGL
ncbi:adhesion G protein-coupled receptor B2-like [Hydra vulgaris]|uniref:Adhesion G protein-coupled receptor B2-like n=1 Tax=Hydra vulgaris TaxID=6087 RepID=A0ABM4B8Q5_HYDVU